MWKKLLKLITSREVVAFFIAELIAGLLITTVVWKLTGGGERGLAWSLASVGFLIVVAGRLQVSYSHLDTQHRFTEVERFLDTVFSLKTSAFKDAGLAKDLATIVEAADQALKIEEVRFADYIRQRLSECSLEMEGFIGGVRAPALISTYWAAEKLQDTKEVFATTYSGAIREFWVSPGGQAYIEANVEAHARYHTSITRAFILDDQPAPPELVEVLRKHVEGGLKVWIARLSGVDPALLDDYLMFDTKCIVFWESAHGSNALTNARWSFKPEVIRRGIEMRRYLEYRSLRITDIAQLETWIASEKSRVATGSNTP